MASGGAPALLPQSSRRVPPYPPNAPITARIAPALVSALSYSGGRSVAAHEYRLVAPAHGARRRCEGGEMKFLRAGLGDDASGVALRDIAARHDREAPGGACDQAADQRRALDHSRLLARRQQSVDVRAGSACRGFRRDRGRHRRPMERHRQRPRRRNQARRSGLRRCCRPHRAGRSRRPPRPLPSDAAISSPIAANSSSL